MDEIRQFPKEKNPHNDNIISTIYKNTSLLSKDSHHLVGGYWIKS